MNNRSQYGQGERGRFQGRPFSSVLSLNDGELLLIREDRRSLSSEHFLEGPFINGSVENKGIVQKDLIKKELTNK